MLLFTFYVGVINVGSLYRKTHSESCQFAMQATFHITAGCWHSGTVLIPFLSAIWIWTVCIQNNFILLLKPWHLCASKRSPKWGCFFLFPKIVFNPFMKKKLVKPLNCSAHFGHQCSFLHLGIKNCFQEKFKKLGEKTGKHGHLQHLK